MCEIPPRQIRPALRPERVVLAVLAVAMIVWGFWSGDVTGLIVLGLGAAALFTAVCFPAIRDIEFGFPSGVKISAALQDREQELVRAFTAQKGELGLYTQLLCNDPSVASRLLEAAWAKTAAQWRGPVTPQLRGHVLCVFVHLLESHDRWTAQRDGPAPVSPAASATPLSALALPQRTVVVLREFAELSLAEVAAIVERPLEAVTADYRDAQVVLAPHIDGGTR